MKPSACDRCSMIKKDPVFWETHQNMSDGRVWCTKKLWYAKDMEKIYLDKDKQVWFKIVPGL